MKTPAEKALSYVRQAYNLIEIDPLPTRQILLLVIKSLLALAHAQVNGQTRHPLATTASEREAMAGERPGKRAGW